MTLVAEAVAVLANMAAAALEDGGERLGEDHGQPLGADRAGLHPPVLDGPGAREHRVDSPPVCPGRRGGPPGVGSVPGRGDRRRLGVVGPIDRGTIRVQGPGGPGVHGRGRRHLRSGDLPAGPILGGPVAPVGVGTAHRHAGHRLRRHLRPGQLQRPSPPGPEEPDVRSRTSLLGWPATRSEAGRSGAGRAAFPASCRVRLRRRRQHHHRP